MKKILNIFKIVTFLNFKLVLISLILVLTTFFGIKYIDNTVKSSNEFSNKIIYNEKVLLTIVRNSNDLTDINNKTLLLCINGKYDSLKYINSIRKIKSNLNVDKKVNYRLEKLFINKVMIFKIINEKSKDKEYLIIDSNELTLKIRVILSEFYELEYKKNLKEFKILNENIDNNLHKYIFTIITLLIIYSILIILIVSDIKIKNRLEFRDKYIISILIGRIKDIMKR